MLQIEHGTEKGSRLIARRAYRAGEVIGRLEGYRTVARPTYLSVQVGPDRHVEGLGIFDHLNHSCAPSVIVDTAEMTVRAARDVAAGEELSFFYPSTEWEMDRPFTCLCGAAGCIGTVAGAKYLPAQVLGRYFVNPHIRALKAAAG